LTVQDAWLRKDPKDRNSEPDSLVMKQFEDAELYVKSFERLEGKRDTPEGRAVEDVLKGRDVSKVGITGRLRNFSVKGYLRPKDRFTVSASRAIVVVAESLVKLDCRMHEQAPDVIYKNPGKNKAGYTETYLISSDELIKTVKKRLDDMRLPLQAEGAGPSDGPEKISVSIEGRKMKVCAARALAHAVARGVQTPEDVLRMLRELRDVKLGIRAEEARDAQMREERELRHQAEEKLARLQAELQEERAKRGRSEDEDVEERDPKRR